MGLGFGSVLIVAAGLCSKVGSAFSTPVAAAVAAVDAAAAFFDTHPREQAAPVNQGRSRITTADTSKAK